MAQRSAGKTKLEMEKVATVLALGLDPTFADFTSMPGLTPELVQAFIDSQLERIRALGYEVESCLVDSGNTAEAVLKESLGKRQYDCVMMVQAFVDPHNCCYLRNFSMWSTCTLQAQRYASTQHLRTQLKRYSGGFDCGRKKCPGHAQDRH
jgi:hypothetical protein